MFYRKGLPKIGKWVFGIKIFRKIVCIWWYKLVDSDIDNIDIKINYSKYRHTFYKIQMKYVNDERCIKHKELHKHLKWGRLEN